ncbi:cystathionine gamma-lyase [Conexibacter arvalis]|uniref:Cystathionine gamma-lyase n=1 Tax=Conexibacter arvalis TaxID=912552 RepID=A0A840IFA1_9ACTN|nr:cystathionine gamma-lyase [Conexibacter arvalis]MBB4662620.1 cystathionine gamma-lyase [Conexibacter arvalis]
MADRRLERFGDGTRAVHAGLPPAEQEQPFLPGPAFAAPYHLRGDDAFGAAYPYGRYGNPTWTALEQAVAQLEGDDVEALVFPSGSAAIAAVLFPLLRAGDTVVVQEDAYPTGRMLASDELGELGVTVRQIPSTTEAFVAAAPGAAVVLLETPSNPGLDLVDVAAVAEAVHAAGGRLVVDNTLASPLGQRPLELGADASLLSGSKHLTGHGDLLLGTVATRDEELLAAARRWRERAGAILGPFEAWLAHRSLATLELRLRRQCDSALAIATALAARVGDDLLAVRYPGLPGDPAHALASRQMRAFGTVLTFDLGDDAERARRMLAACELVIEATSFGSVHTMAERRARWGTDAVTEGLIRLSVGIEDADDLIADLTQALDATR